MWLGGQDVNAGGGQVRTEADFLRASEHLARSIAASRQALMGGPVVEQASSNPLISNPLSSHPAGEAAGYPYHLQPRGQANGSSLRPMMVPQSVQDHDTSNNPGTTLSPR